MTGLFNAIWQFKTGKPFTPDARYPGLVLIGKETSSAQFQEDARLLHRRLRFDKNFQVWKLNYTFTVRVENLFDTKNVNDVYSTTGLPYTNVNKNGRILTGLPINSNPGNYDPGRQVNFGMSLNF